MIQEMLLTYKTTNKTKEGLEKQKEKKVSLKEEFNLRLKEIQIKQEKVIKKQKRIDEILKKLRKD